MGTIVIAMPRSEDAFRYEAAVKRYGLMLETAVARSGAEVLRIANERDFGVVICTSRLSDMAYSELAEYLPVAFGMIILTKDDSIETFSERMVKLLVPMRVSELISTIEMLTSAYVQQRKRKEKPPRKKSEEEIRIIDKAKRVLMDRNGMTEPEAFRYIQKISMDTGRKAVETAEMILCIKT